MKKLLFISIAMVSMVFRMQDVVAQNPETDTTSVDRFLLDFTVPDMPAFKALGTTPSEILRPSDIKKFAVMLQPFVSNGQAIIPKSFALEVAPFKLMESYRGKPQLSISDYATKKKDFRRILYATSISLGSLRTEGEDAISKVSIGLRTSFTGKKGDILKDTDFQNKYIYGPLQAYQKQRSDEQTNWMRLHNLRPSDLLSDSVIQAFEKHLEEDLHLSAPDKNQEIQKAITRYNKENWNASRGELAIAWVGQSPDSLINNITFGSFDVWGVWAIRVKSHGQLLLGTHLQRPKKAEAEIDADAFNVTFNTRFYYGTTNFRFFGELQYKNKNQVDEKKLGLVNLGSEFRVLKDFWIVLSGGVENLFDDNKSRFVSSLDIRYSFNKPE